MWFILYFAKEQIITDRYMTNMKRLNNYITLCGLVILLFSCGSNDVKENQTISFSYLAPHNLSEGSFVLKATATSGLPVTFLSSDSSTAIIRDSTVTLLKTGSVYITAVQPGNTKYYAAAMVTRTLAINEDNNPIKKNQTITFELNDTIWKVSQGPLTLKATASSYLPVTFTSSDISYASIIGDLLTVISGYDGAVVIITASQAGDDEYNAAPTVSHALKVIHDVH
ncbi:MAG: hypothetical protein Q8904_00580 [Bacteroidota bacterium]|nr:hypothetical protein [Bacteroidota bacterium]